MSVQCNQYLCYGYMLDYKKARSYLIEKLSEEGYELICDNYDDNAFKDDITIVDGCSMIWDGMSGKYVFFGHIFSKAKTGRLLETIVIPTITEKIKIITEHEFKRIFGKDFNVEPNMMILTHYR